MHIVLDASVVIAVVTNERHKSQLVELAKGADLLAPASLHWEIGNALSAMFKRRRITLQQASRALGSYQRIPIQFADVDLVEAVGLAEKLKIYAYDAYVIQCALKHKSPLLTLDRVLVRSARKAGATVLEVKP